MIPTHPIRRCSARLALAAVIFLGASIPIRADIALRKIADGLINPLNLVSLGDSTDTLLIADQAGTIHVWNNGSLKDKLFLDIRSRTCDLRPGFDERGLLGLALHPRFAENGRFFIYYSAPLRDGAPPDWDSTTQVSEFKVSADNPEVADPDSERVLLQIDQPAFNHNGGRLAFGPDGFLYISVGDGGGGNDNENGHNPRTGNGQDVTRLNGKILRIDVDGAKPYAIPRDNPFVGKTGRNEIFAFGIRNPWGMSFDKGGSHELFVSDVGQNRFEEVNIVTLGGNYGWRIREAAHGFDPAHAREEVPNDVSKDAFGNDLIDPIISYKNRNSFRNDPDAYGISVTGGYVYRGGAIPDLQGTYVFADWSESFAGPLGVLLAATRSGDGWGLARLPVDGYENSNLGLYITAFGQDADGELYILANGVNGLQALAKPELKSGVVYKIVKK